jgi:hypothetical protein
MPTIRPLPTSLKCLLGAVVVIGIAWLLIRSGKSPDLVDSPKQIPARGERVFRDPSVRDWAGLVALIDQGASSEEIRQQLADTKAKWCEEDPRVMAEKIAILLRDHEDRETGLEFETGHGGGLRSWPSLRVFLLDVLMSTDPDVAVEVAREVLAETDSAEEYAVAMRALVMEKPWRAGDDELHAYLANLLAREDWQKEGRAGFAEAMDLVREIGTAQAFQSLAEWVDGSPSFKEAGAMSLHEFAAEYPDKMSQSVAEEPSLLASDPGLRAGLMARIDPMDPKQLRVLEGYLSSGEVTVAEKRDFLRLFPLRSATTGFRLYAGTPAPYDLDQVKVSDLAAAEAVEAWLGRADLNPLNSELLALQQRLDDWRKQAEAVDEP